MALPTTTGPLTVSTDGTAGPYVIVTPDQFGPVVEALREVEISFHVEEDAILLDGSPALVIIDLGIDADVSRIQLVLDAVAARSNSNRRGGISSTIRRGLALRGDPGAMREFTRRLKEASLGNWIRRTDIEKRMRKGLPERTSAYCFTKRVPAVGTDVAVLLRGRGPGDLGGVSVSGVVPVESQWPLDAGQQEQVLVDFRATFLAPLVGDLGIRIVEGVQSREPVLEDLLSQPSLELLRDFTKRSTKVVLLPFDLRRWSGFVGRTHLDNADIELGMLARWLEAEGFPPELRDRLTGDFEAGRLLLSVYDEELRQ